MRECTKQRSKESTYFLLKPFFRTFENGLPFSLYRTYFRIEKQVSVLFLVSILILSGCKTVLIESSSTLNNTHHNNLSWLAAVGTWYGHLKNSNLERLEVIIVHDPNGIYRAKTRRLGNEETLDIEVVYGEWGLSGPVYFSIPRAFEQGNEIIRFASYSPDQANTFKIAEFTEMRMKLIRYSDNLELTMVRVRDNFNFSDSLE